ncbi:hypothetical protein McanMca71_007888 [Microsporum canis]
MAKKKKAKKDLARSAAVWFEDPEPEKSEEPSDFLAVTEDTPPIIAYEMGEAEDTLRASLKSYFDSSKFTDLVIRTVDDDFKVHKVVVCGQSEYFTRLFDGDWKETAENVVDLSKDDPATIEAMVRFMYEADYDGSGSNRGRISPMLFNARVYEVAEKYSILHLKERAKTKFKDAVRTCWDMDDFSPAIKEVYTNTPSIDRGLRDIISQTAFQNIESLLRKDDFQSVLVEYPGFSADVVRLQANSSHPPPANPQRTRCNNCGYNIY